MHGEKAFLRQTARIRLQIIVQRLLK